MSELTYDPSRQYEVGCYSFTYTEEGTQPSSSTTPEGRVDGYCTYVVVISEDWNKELFSQDFGPDEGEQAASKAEELADKFHTGVDYY